VTRGALQRRYRIADRRRRLVELGVSVIGIWVAAYLRGVLIGLISIAEKL
jgi:hypothetical protein